MDVNVDQAHLIGIKLSAGQLDSVTTDLRGRILLTERTVPLTGTNPQSVVDTIAAVIDDASRDDDTLCAVGRESRRARSRRGPRSSTSHPFSSGPMCRWWR